jgi:hypothetical protein
MTSLSLAHWLIVDGRDFNPEVFTTRLPSGDQALVVFSFREEGEMYLRLEGGIDRGQWRFYKSSVEELLSVLWGQCRDVGYVVMDPLPQGLSEKLITHYVMGRHQFMDFLMGRRPSKVGEFELQESHKG